MLFLFLVKRALKPEYDYNAILDLIQPLAVGFDIASFVITLKKKGLSRKQTELYYDALEINFLGKADRYELETGIISEGEHSWLDGNCYPDRKYN